MQETYRFLVLEKHHSSWHRVKEAGSGMWYQSLTLALPLHPHGTLDKLCSLFCLSVPIWATEGSTCPPLIPLWNPSRGPLFSVDHSQPHTTYPSSCFPIYSPWPLPVSLQQGPPDGLLRAFLGKRLPTWSSLHWGWRAGGCGLDLGPENGSLGWRKGQCCSVSSSTATDFL